jgi:hypothetical protein
MWVALELEIPYLWVDRYCIDQTNDAEKHHLIQNINIIYSDTALTIVAAAGDGPHHDLPGINHTYRPSQITIVRPSGLEYIAIHEPFSELSGSTWSTRAWTFQGYYLSRRRWIFTDTQMYLTCKTRHHIESFTLENEENFTTDNSNPSILAILKHASYFDPESRRIDEISDLFRQPREYYIRDLSYREDIIKAFLGVVHGFGQSPGVDPLLGAHIHGLPIFYLRRLMVTSPTAVFASGSSWSIAHANEMRDISANKSTVFFSWIWPCIKADRRKASVGKLYFMFTPDDVSYQDGISVWVTRNTDGRIDLDHYIGGAEHPPHQRGH